MLAAIGLGLELRKKNPTVYTSTDVLHDGRLWRESRSFRGRGDVASKKKQTLLIIGAGPIGTELALHAADDFDIVVCEAKTNLAGNVREWGHVRLFSPWSLNVSSKGRQAITLNVDDTAFPTGAE